MNMSSECEDVVNIEIETKTSDPRPSTVENMNESFFTKYKKWILILTIIGSILVIVSTIVLCAIFIVNDVNTIFDHSKDVMNKFSQSTNANNTGNINSDKIIWHVWEQGESNLNSFDLGVLTLRLSRNAEQYGFKVIVVTKDNLWQYLSPLDLPNKFDEIDTPAHKSDIIRVSLLNKYGGIYFDIGTLLFNPQILEVWWNKMHENGKCKAFSMYLYHPSKNDLAYKQKKNVAEEDIKHEYQFAVTGGCKGSLFMKAMQYFNVETMYHRKTAPKFHYSWRGKYLSLGDVTAFEIVQRNKDYFYPHQYDSGNANLFTVNAMGATEVYKTQTIYNKLKNLKQYIGKNPFFLIPQSNENDKKPDLIKFTNVGAYKSVKMDALLNALQDLL